MATAATMATRVYEWHGGCFVGGVNTDYAVLVVNGEVYCRYEGAGALAIATEDVALYADAIARLATAAEIATWPK